MHFSERYHHVNINCNHYDIISKANNDLQCSVQPRLPLLVYLVPRTTEEQPMAMDDQSAAHSPSFYRDEISQAVSSVL